MLIKGKLLRIGFRHTNQYIKMSQETSCSITICQRVKTRVGEERCSDMTATLKTWSITGDMLLNIPEFSFLFDNVKNNEYVYTEFSASCKKLTGRVIITSMNIAGQGNGIVHCNFSAQGDGPLLKNCT